MIGMPGAISDFFRSRRQMRGLEALSKGVVAAGAGDAAAAQRYSVQANRILTNEPLAQLLKAQAAQLAGDKSTVKRVFDAMLQDTETEALGLRGLFVQARQDGDFEQARRYAERALAISPHLNWAARAVLAVQSSDGDWAAAEATLDLCRRNKLMDADEATRKKAVVTTARAADLEDRNPERALELALAAHKAAPDLVPAAVIAGRVLAATGQTRKASKVLEKTWRLAPHPEVADVFAAARPGSAPRDRLKRTKALIRKIPASVEGPVALARAAVAAQEWADAREALEPLIDDRPSARICALMAEIEEQESGDEGRSREWLARAVSAPRDPVWTADGYTSDTWQAYSPASGELDAFRWKVPLEGLNYGAAEEAPATAQVPVHHEDVQPDDPGPDAEVLEAVEEDAPAPVEAAASEAETGENDGGAEDQGSGAAKQRIFVPPRAPDDPGPDSRDEPAGNMFQALFAR
jgi:HemY protein